MVDPRTAPKASEPRKANTRRAGTHIRRANLARSCSTRRGQSRAPRRPCTASSTPERAAPSAASARPSPGPTFSSARWLAELSAVAGRLILGARRPHNGAGGHSEGWLVMFRRSRGPPRLSRAISFRRGLRQVICSLNISRDRVMPLRPLAAFLASYVPDPARPLFPPDG